MPDVTKCKGIEIGMSKKEWSGEVKKCYVISLGEIVDPELLNQ